MSKSLEDLLRDNNISPAKKIVDIIELYMYKENCENIKLTEKGLYIEK